jgi:hypothetical protein
MVLSWYLPEGTEESHENNLSQDSLTSLTDQHCHSNIHFLTHSFAHYLFIHFLPCSFSHSFILTPFIYITVHSLMCTLSLVCPFPCCFTYFLIFPLLHPFTHSLIYSLIVQAFLCWFILLLIQASPQRMLYQFTLMLC